MKRLIDIGTQRSRSAFLMVIAFSCLGFLGYLFEKRTKILIREEREHIRLVCNRACSGMEWTHDCTNNNRFAATQCACTCSNGTQVPMI